jgi:hypothetical protein
LSEDCEVATNDRLVDGQAIPPVPERIQDLVSEETARWKDIDPPKPAKQSLLSRANAAIEKLLRW